MLSGGDEHFHQNRRWRAGGTSNDEREAKLRWSSSMCFQHVGDACGSVGVLGADLSEEQLSIIVKCSITAESGISPRGGALLGQEPQKAVRVRSVELVRQAKEDVLRHVVSPKD